MSKLSKGQRAVKGRDPAADVMSALVVEVLKLAAAIEEAGNALARPTGQTSARWLVLAAVEVEARTVAAIARVLSHRRQSVQRVADLLVDEGLARYRDNPAHRRSNLLELTAAGRETLGRIQVAQAAWVHGLSDSFDPVELEATRSTLAGVAARLESFGGKPGA